MPQMGYDTKTDRLTDCQSQCDFDFDLFLDNENAFDTIWHWGLLYNMSKFEISRRLIQLISWFLSERKFRVSVEGEMATPWEMQAGVPQGSVLSPTLYNIYMRQIAKRVSLLENSSAASTHLRPGVLCNIKINEVVDHLCLVLLGMGKISCGRKLGARLSFYINKNIERNYILRELH
jgi:retron-type reverse transcriptase